MREMQGRGPGLGETTVNLTEKMVQAADLTVPFEIDDHTRRRLRDGLDDIGLTRMPVTLG